MNVVVNGDNTEVADGASLVDLLHELGLGEKWVVVERNGDAVARAAMASVTLAPGDRLEVVRAVAGG